MINPYVLPVSPRLLWQTEVGGWNLLAFDYIAGRHADYSPGSDDLPRVIKVMDLLGQITCPDLPLKRAEQRWASHFEDISTAELLRGDSLLHTDFNPVNVLITADSTYLIDWAWPTRGAAWIDPACLVLRLMAAGHTAAEAETWAAHNAAWINAPSDGVTTFAHANRNMWREIADADPQPWKQRMAAVATNWAEYRS